VDKYVIVIEFAFTEVGRVFYLAHVFRIDRDPFRETQSYQITLTAYSCVEAFELAKDALWLLE
jgi:hypothetical protein